MYSIGILATLVVSVLAEPLIHRAPRTDGSGWVLYPDPSDNTAQCTPDGRLCIGTWFSSENWPHLEELGVTHIVSAIGEPHRGRWPNAEYLVMDLDDHSEQDMGDAFAHSHAFISNALAMRDDSVVLVHCAAGVSRSSAIIINHWMQEDTALEFDDALDRLRKVRHVVAPNPGFVHQLKKQKDEL